MTTILIVIACIALLWWCVKPKSRNEGWNGNKEDFPEDPEEGDYFDGQTGKWNYSGDRFKWLPTCPCKGCEVELIGFTKCMFRECASCSCERMGIRVKVDGPPRDIPKCKPRSGIIEDIIERVKSEPDFNGYQKVNEMKHLGMLRQKPKYITVEVAIGKKWIGTEEGWKL